MEYEKLVGGINFWAPPIVELIAEWCSAHGWDNAMRRSTLDIGCGTGIYSHLLLQKFPANAAYGIDVPRIVPFAEKQAARLGVSDRFHVITADFFTDPWPTPVDMTLLVNIFHLQPEESARRLLRRCAECIAEDGIVCIVDHIVDREGDLDSPQDRFAMLFAASMLATGGGDAHPLHEYDNWLADAGLRRLDLLDAPMHRILLAGKAH